MIACRDKDDADYLRSLRAHGWCRDLPDDNKIYKKTGDNFKDSFTFVTPGYSVRPLEMSGAIGSVQLKKWPKMEEQRRKNAQLFQYKFEEFPGIELQKEIGQSSWFGFSILLTNQLKGKRDSVVKALTENGVECRPIVAGNFMRNPVIDYLDYYENGSYPNANYIHDNGLFIGNDIRDLRDNIDEVYTIIKEIK